MAEAEDLVQVFLQAFMVSQVEGKAPHTLRKRHLQVKHEVVKPFFRNTVMEAHCKRGEGDRD